MGDYAIQCTVCDGSFDSEKEYNEHGCSEEDAKLSLNIKVEPEDDDDGEAEGDELINLNNESNGEMINIKSEPIDNMEDDFPKECAQEDPLGIQGEELHSLNEDTINYTEVQNETNETGSADEAEDLNHLMVSRGQKSTKQQLPFTYLKDFSCKCRLCNIVFSKKEEFTKHFREAHKTFRPFECGICGKKFLHKHYVNLHMRVHTGERPYVCQLCPRAYSHKTSFTIHMRIHNGERPYACEVCGKKCYDKSGLTSHMRSHTKETPYQCEVCGRRFTHSKSLLVHRRNHTGEKPYVCSYCGKAFRHWHKHKIHVRLHTGERPYKCKVCGKGFPRNDEVSRHMRSHQGIKSFKCSICGVYCATQASITGHINLHHYNLKAESEEPPPEKTLVKDSTSGILGSKAPEPRSLYRLASKITGSTSVTTGLKSVNEKTIYTLSDKFPDKVTMNERLSTRVIEITSKDTPINIPSSAKKSLSKKMHCILPKPKTTLESSETKAMNYQEFLKWQERMLANQGLIVKGYPSSNSKTSNNNSTNTTLPTTSSTFSTNTSSTKGTTTSEISSCTEKNQSAQSTSASAPGQKVNKPQYLLLSQGTDGNATKILLPLNMIEHNSLTKTGTSGNLTTSFAPNTPTATNGSQGNRMLLLPQMSTQPLLLLSSGGQRMLLMPSQNVNKPISSDHPDVKQEKVQIKEDPDFFPPELTIKTELDLSPESEEYDTANSNFQEIKIKEEPKDF